MVEVAALEFESEECSTYRFKSIRLDYWPFFDNFCIMIRCQEKSYFVKLADRLIKTTDFENVETIFSSILFISGTVDGAILESMN